MSLFHVYLTTTAGALVGCTLVAYTLRRQYLRPTAGRICASHLHLVEALARPLLGIGFVLLALFVPAARTFWADLHPSALPGWALPSGVGILAACTVGGQVAGGCALARRVRPTTRR